MTIPATPYPLYLAQGLVKLVEQLSPGIIPTASLAVASSVGDQTLQVNGNAAAFIPDTVINFTDGTGSRDDEKKVRVGSVDLLTQPYPTIYLNFEGRTSPGLTAPHPQDTVISTNVFRTYLGEQVNSSLDNGYPVIGIWVMNNLKQWRANAQWQNQAIGSVLYRLSGKQPDGPKLHPQIWLEETLDRAEYDTQALVAALQVNSTIRVDGNAYAFLVTQFVTARRDSLADPSNPVFEFLVDIHAQGLFESTRP